MTPEQRKKLNDALVRRVAPEEWDSAGEKRREEMRAELGDSMTKIGERIAKLRARLLSTSDEQPEEICTCQPEI